MRCGRRQFLFFGGVVALYPLATSRAQEVRGQMFGLIGKMTAVAGQRETLIRFLLEGTTGLPGCLSYVVATDPGEADAIWVTEVWDSEASHKASLTLPAVRAAIEKARPLIGGFGTRVATVPVGGVGLAPRG